MRTVLWIGLGLLVVVALVVVGLGAGWALWGRGLWAASPDFEAPVGRDPRGCAWEYGRGPGMIPGIGWTWGAESGKDTSHPWCLDGDRRWEGSDGLTITEAWQAVEQFLSTNGYRNLEVSEVMEFEENFYAVARERDTGIGAAELLVDKATGAVGPEMGPNMMWNARYGMHRRGGMMRSGSQVEVLPEEAVDIADRWLDTNRPGVSADDHADRFYGYYTIHTLENGQIEGMLSVHGTTGAVWYHNWHGDFVQMVGEEEDH